MNNPLRSSAVSTCVLLAGLLAAGVVPAAAEDAVPVLRLAAVDNALLEREDLEAAGPGVPVRFALPLEVRAAVESDGRWEQLAGGGERWRLRVSSPGALHLNFGFRRFRLPEGAHLRVYAADKADAIRPFTAADNASHGELWTPILRGDEAVLDLVVPAGARRHVDLELGVVGHGYRKLGGPVVTGSGSCNVDVICPEGDGWRDEIRSVAAISTGGSLFCSGFLVNNTAQDLTPYFMTANHCGIGAGNAASLVVYWNYENSICRMGGGGAGDGMLTDFQTGAFFRAASSASDFTIVELDSPPDPDWNVHWAGWDRTSADFAGATAIHHPSVQEKRISFENDPTATSSYLGTTSPGDGTHVRVVDWDLGTTEGGSSGSPLFNPARRIIGQLHGGGAACGNNDSDYYGRISVSWTGGGSSSTRLSNWLDPGATGATTLDGRDASAIRVTPGELAVCAPANAVYTVDVTAIGGDPGAVTLGVTGNPAGTTTGFAPNPVTPPGASTLTISSTGSAAPGESVLTVTGTSTGGMEQDEALLTIFAGAPAAPALTSPADGAINQPIRPTLAWGAVADAATYDVQVATDAGFGSIVENVTGVTDPTHTVGVDLAGDELHYWRVRAANPCGAGSFSAARSFTTAPAPGECGGGAVAVPLFDEDLEGGAVGWTHSGSGDTWTLSGTQTHSPTHAYFGNDVASVTDQRLVTPAISLPNGSGLVLRFWHWRDLEDGGAGCFDGGVIEVSDDAGANWTRLDGEILVDPYDGEVDDRYDNPIQGTDAWCGTVGWTEAIVDLGAWAGSTVQVRFRLATDESVAAPGWYVDDVRVTECLVETPLFVDGFESGDVSAWSNAVP